MTYTLNFISKFGLWELQVNRFRARFYRTRDAAMKTVTRYRQMLKSEQDRYDRREEIERESFAEMRHQAAAEDAR
jgi:hypothetical protein